MHRDVVRRRLVPRVDDQNAERDESRLLKIALHEPPPAVALGLGDLRVAVAGQIDEVEPAVDFEVVDLRRFAGTRADAGKIFAVHHAVDDARFADVRASRERDLRQSVMDELRGHGRAQDKFRLVEVDRHKGSLRFC